MKGIELRKVTNIAALLPLVNISEADAEFLYVLQNNADIIRTVYHDDTLVGIVQAERTPDFLYGYIYIFPVHRRRGYGKAVLQQLEEQHSPACREIMICYRGDDPSAGALSKSCGYTTTYTSDYMVYTGQAFESEPLPVRPYCDADYGAAQALAAEVFHRMRLSTGCFPTSAPDVPSEEERREWAETAAERLVYVQDGAIVGIAHVVGSEIDSLAIHTDHQGKGIGRKFLKHIINRI